MDRALFDSCHNHYLLLNANNSKLMYIFLKQCATWRAEVGRIVVQDLPGQIFHKTPFPKVNRVLWTGGVT
jgi:hypothetical protein